MFSSGECPVCLRSFYDSKNLLQKPVVVLEEEIHRRVVSEKAAMHSPVKIHGTFYGLLVGLDAFHIHEGSELGERCQLVRPHFNPRGKSQGGPRDEDRHTGDFGNIKVSTTSLSSSVAFVVIMNLGILHREIEEFCESEVNVDD